MFKDKVPVNTVLWDLRVQEDILLGVQFSVMCCLDILGSTRPPHTPCTLQPGAIFLVPHLFKIKNKNKTERKGLISGVQPYKSTCTTL